MNLAEIRAYRKRNGIVESHDLAGGGRVYIVKHDGRYVCFQTEPYHNAAPDVLDEGSYTDCMTALGDVLRADVCDELEVC